MSWRLRGAVHVREGWPRRCCHPATERGRRAFPVGQAPYLARVVVLGVLNTNAVFPFLRGRHAGVPLVLGWGEYLVAVARLPSLAGRAAAHKVLVVHQEYSRNPVAGYSDLHLRRVGREVRGRRPFPCLASRRHVSLTECVLGTKAQTKKNAAPSLRSDVLPPPPPSESSLDRESAGSCVGADPVTTIARRSGTGRRETAGCGEAWQPRNRRDSLGGASKEMRSARSNTESWRRQRKG